VVTYSPKDYGDDSCTILTSSPCGGLECNAIGPREPGPMEWNVESAILSEVKFNDITSFDENNAIAVGDFGKIWTTTNGGEEWVGRACGVATNLHGCSAFGAERWTVGDFGVILHSEDGGVNWVAQNSTTELPLSDVYFVDSINGWAVGDFGTILRTENSGESWNKQESTVSQDLNCIEFLNPSFGWCVGNNGVILNTVNGGSTWILQDAGTDKDVISVSCVGENSGYIAVTRYSLGEAIFKTIDGGASWLPIGAELVFTNITAADFLDENFGWVSRYGIIYETSNGGENWNNSYNTIGAIESVFIFSESVGWAAGGNRGAWIAKKANTGLWEYQAENIAVPLNMVKMVNGDKGWAVGGNYFNVSGGSPNLILSTFDGGESWEEQLDILGSGLYDLAPIDELRCFALAGNGVYRTLDGGSDWDLVEMAGAHLLSISFPSEIVGYVAGSAGRMYKTIDAGDTWEYLPPGIGNTYFQSVSFLNEDEGWASGYGVDSSPFRTRIIHTVNGGQSWEVQYDEAPGGPTRVFFVSSLEGWAVSSGGKILHTVNGGGTWEEQNSGVSVNLFGLYFQDRYSGWVAGDNGNILETEDGGLTWIVEESGTTYKLHSVDSNYPHGIWVAADYGYILHKDNDGPPSSVNGPQKTTITKLFAAFPNPFNPATTIRYDLPRREAVNLRVYDITGRHVKSLVLGTVEEPGINEVTWYGRDDAGRVVAAGVYFYRLEAGTFCETKRMVLVK